MNAFKRLCTNHVEFHSLVTSIEDTKVQNAQSEGCIVTHNGIFHCDEALACGLLKVLPQFRMVGVCRTRDKTLISKGNIVVDVGGMYDPVNNRFDHHQNGFSETFPGRETKLSSAGLVYLHYGKEIISTLKPSLSPEEVELVYNRVYRSFVEEIDGSDNGIEPFSGGKRNYCISTSLTLRVASLRPFTDVPEEQNNRFIEAMVLTMTEFYECLNSQVCEWLPARTTVRKAILDASKIHESGAIIRLDRFIQWKSHIKEIEEEFGIQNKLQFCLFPQGDIWIVQAMPSDNDADMFGIRNPLKWKGLEGDVLCSASGISNSIFVHGSGFMGSNKTYDGALNMAIASMLN